MPYLNFGQSTSFDNSKNLIVALKERNQKITFRILGQGFYDGIHFIKKENRFNVSFCPRIMSGDYCLYCEKANETKLKINELNAKLKATEDKKQKIEIKLEIEDLEKELRNNKVKINFYYPIIDRNEKKAKILKTTLSVRLKIEEFYNNGVDILNQDFSLVRTERPGSGYYELIKIENIPITEAEKKEIDQASKWELEKIVLGKKSKFNLEKHNENSDVYEIYSNE